MVENGRVANSHEIPVRVPAIEGSNQSPHESPFDPRIPANFCTFVQNP